MFMFLLSSSLYKYWNSPQWDNFILNFLGCAPFLSFLLIWSCRLVSAYQDKLVDHKYKRRNFDYADYITENFGEVTFQTFVSMLLEKSRRVCKGRFYKYVFTFFYFFEMLIYDKYWWHPPTGGWQLPAGQTLDAAGQSLCLLPGPIHRHRQGRDFSGGFEVHWKIDECKLPTRW